MTGAEHTDELLTYEESFLVESINGLENQAEALYNSVRRAHDHTKAALGIGSASTVMFFMEHSKAAFSPEKVLYMSLAAGAAVGGITQFVREHRMRGQIRQKIELSDKHRQELDPSGVGLFNNVLTYSVGEE